jgi:hypothetical protein
MSGAREVERIAAYAKWLIAGLPTHIGFLPRLTNEDLFCRNAEVLKP